MEWNEIHNNRGEKKEKTEANALKERAVVIDFVIHSLNKHSHLRADTTLDNETKQAKNKNKNETTHTHTIHTNNSSSFRIIE